MQVHLVCRPAYAAAYCHLAYDEAILVEREGMVAMDSNFDVSAGVGKGGVVTAAMRKAFGGESFFMGRYRATVDGAWVLLAPAYPGDVEAVDIVPGRSLLVQSGCLLAAGPGLDIDVRYAGMSNVLIREGATILKLHGSGTALVSAYGGIQKLTLEDGQAIIVDTGHIVAYSDTVTLRTGALAGPATTQLIGEGLVCQVSGPGDIFLQTRAERAHRNWFVPGRGQNGHPTR